MADSRVDMLEERIDRLEKKVDDGFAAMGRRFDEVYTGMSQGFAEHRRLLTGELGRRIEPLERGLARLERRLDAHDTRFDRLETRLDGFIEAQAVVNRRLLEYLDRQG